MQLRRNRLFAAGCRADAHGFGAACCELFTLPDDTLDGGSDSAGGQNHGVHSAVARTVWVPADVIHALVEVAAADSENASCTGAEGGRRLPRGRGIVASRWRSAWRFNSRRWRRSSGDTRAGKKQLRFGTCSSSMKRVRAQQGLPTSALAACRFLGPTVAEGSSSAGPSSLCVLSQMANSRFPPAVTGLGWRYPLGTGLRRHARVATLASWGEVKPDLRQRLAGDRRRHASLNTWGEALAEPMPTEQSS